MKLVVFDYNPKLGVLFASTVAWSVAVVLAILCIAFVSVSAGQPTVSDQGDGRVLAFLTILMKFAVRGGIIGFVNGCLLIPLVWARSWRIRLLRFSIALISLLVVTGVVIAIFVGLDDIGPPLLIWLGIGIASSFPIAIWAATKDPMASTSTSQ